MSFCKICACGEKVVFERRLGYPENCPACGRKLSEFRTFAEDDPMVAELMKEKDDSADASITESNSFPGEFNQEKQYVLKLFNGKEIKIPSEGCVIGRTETGAEELAEFPSVSRQHLRVVLKRVGVFIEDISRYGTLLDGQRLIKNTPVRVADGAKISLCNVDAEIVVKEGESK